MGSIVSSGHIGALASWGDRDSLREIGDRLRRLMPSAQALNEAEALSVAQVAIAHNLDPFNGEVWGIKDADKGKWYGVMVGIKGLRKAAQRQADAENSVYWTEFLQRDAKQYTDQQHAVAYECVLRDSATMQAYGKAIHALTTSGVPYAEAVAMCGPAPAVKGIGIAHPAERSKMGLHHRARKRAEADALKQRYSVSFGDAVVSARADDDDAPELWIAEASGAQLAAPSDDNTIDAQASEPKPTATDERGVLDRGLALYADLSVEAEKYGLQAEQLRDGITLPELRAMYAELKEYVENARQQVVLPE